MHFYPTVDILYALTGAPTILALLALWLSTRTRRRWLVVCTLVPVLGALVLVGTVHLINLAPTPDDALYRMVVWMGGLLFVMILTLGSLVAGMRVDPLSDEEIARRKAARDNRRINDSYEFPYSA